MDFTVKNPPLSIYINNSYKKLSTSFKYIYLQNIGQRQAAGKTAIS